jgi:hypothetical protein
MGMSRNVYIERNNSSVDKNKSKIINEFNLEDKNRKNQGRDK